MRGRAPAPVVMTLARELTREDLDRLYLSPGMAPPTLARVRATHHRQAQLIAEGRPLTEVAAICGTTQSRLSLLCNDPTFSELIAYYSDQVAEIEFETHKRVQETLVDVLELAANEMQDRLTDGAKRAALSMAELRKVAEFAADRTIAPPRASQQGSGLPPARIELNFGWNGPQPNAAEKFSQKETIIIESKSDGELESEFEFAQRDRNDEPELPAP